MTAFFQKLGKVASLLGLLAASSSLQALDAAQLIPPGRFVDLETHRLYYECMGSGQPAVVIDYGIGGSAIAWRDLQQRLAGETTVCAYDRAGYGWSDPGPSPRTTESAAAELHALVEHLKLAGPIVLVGHSFGGFNTRYYAARWPTEVAGLVWLDSSHPEEALGARAKHPGTALTNPLDASRIATEQVEGNQAVGAYLNTRRKAIFTQMDELAHFADSARQVLAAGALPKVPLIVLVRDAANGEPSAAAETRWHQSQATLAELSPLGQLWRATGSGHDIYRDRPDLVEKAVREVVESARKRGSVAGVNARQGPPAAPLQPQPRT